MRPIETKCRIGVGFSEDGSLLIGTVHHPEDESGRPHFGWSSELHPLVQVKPLLLEGIHLVLSLDEPPSGESPVAWLASGELELCLDRGLAQWELQRLLQGYPGSWSPEENYLTVLERLTWAGAEL